MVQKRGFKKDSFRRRRGIRWLNRKLGKKNTSRFISGIIVLLWVILILFFFWNMVVLQYFPDWVAGVVSSQLRRRLALTFLGILTFMVVFLFLLREEIVLMMRKRRSQKKKKKKSEQKEEVILHHHGKSVFKRIGHRIQQLLHQRKESLPQRKEVKKVQEKNQELAHPLQKKKKDHQLFSRLKTGLGMFFHKKKLLESHTEPEKHQEVVEQKKEKKITFFHLGPYQTILDAVYALVQQNGSVSLTEIIEKFKVKKELAEEWAKILESHNLIILHYSPLGSLELKLPPPIEKEVKHD